MKKEIENIKTPEYFTNIALDDTQKRVLNYKEAYSQLGNSFIDASKTIAKGVSDYDDLKIRQFNSILSEKQNTYLSMMSVTNTQEDRDRLTTEFKNSITPLAKETLNDRQIQKWTGTYGESFIKNIDEKHIQESFLGIRRNVRDEGLKSAQNIIDTVVSDEDTFNESLKQADDLKNTMKQYMLQKDFDIFDANLTNAMYERKAMKDIDAGLSKDVYNDLSAGGIKYKVSKENGDKIKEYAYKIYHKQLQSGIAMTVIGKASTPNGTDYTKASDILLKNGKGLDYEDLKGALDIVSLMQNADEKNKRIKAEDSFMNKYNYALDMQKKGEPITAIIDMIHSYDPYLTPRDEESLVGYFTSSDTSTGYGPNKGLGNGYINMLQKVVDKDIVTENDARLYQARVSGELTENGLDSLKKHIKTIQTPENQAISKDILDKADALYKTNTNLIIASDAEKAYIKQRLMDNISSIDTSNANGRLEIDKLRDLGYLQNTITKYRSEYDGTMSDTQARIDLEDKYAVVKKDITNQINILSDKLNSGTITEKDFKKDLNNIIKVNQYKLDNNIMEYYDIDDKLSELTDLYNINKNTKKVFWTTPKNSAKITGNMVNKTISTNVRRQFDNPVKASMTIDEFTKSYNKGVK